MINSAAEFLALRTSDDPADQRRAGHEAAAAGVWLDVIEKYPAMREWVAYNKTVPLEVLELLASDPDERVRWGVAVKRKISADLLRKLALDEDETVRARVAGHHRATIELLQSLLTDESWVVSQAAEKALSAKRGVSGGT